MKIRFVPMLMSGLVAIAALAACADHDDPLAQATPVTTSGKIQSELDGVPPEVLAVVYAAEPDFEVLEAEFEQREERQYYDVGGKMPDGTEWEFDMLLDESGWRIVERQRDVNMTDVPEPVGDALRGHAANWPVDRIIESDQGDGLVIYEFFGADTDTEVQKIEVKWQGEVAEVLLEEWAH